LKIKSYYARTIAEAIGKARNELGADAVIVASRKNDGPSAHLGPYEVVCGTFEEKPQQVEPAPPPMPAAPERPVKRTALRETLAGVRQQVDSLRASVRGRASTPDGDLLAVRAKLASAGFADSTEEIIAGVKQRLRAESRISRGAADKQAGGTDAEAALASELRARLAVSADLGRPRTERKVVALIGPPGAGKTSTIVKLAVAYGLTARKGMHIVTMDSYRLGGSDQLRGYASAMGVGFDSLETVGTLSQCLEENAGKGLVLIDTPGYDGADTATAPHLASFMSRHPEIDVHLVIPAYMSAADQDLVINRFKPFLPSKLLFTHFDSAASSGALIAQSVRTEKPISFLGTGQAIPEDLAPATSELLIDRFVRPKTHMSAVSLSRSAAQRTA
jgi:flagellar biosynthesis protein FlhF